ncbi:hypothetical protein B0H10DRAFT_1953375 [Mycena sp. CBHHK59/15]|nr:hypothetical protein B0H10DRAFT_1953375 [Mycena sp. CBHHK59/15]
MALPDKAVLSFWPYLVDTCPESSTEVVAYWSPFLEACLLYLRSSWPHIGAIGIFLNYTSALCFDDKLNYSYVPKLYIATSSCVKGLERASITSYAPDLVL